MTMDESPRSGRPDCAAEDTARAAGARHVAGRLGLNKEKKKLRTDLFSAPPGPGDHLRLL